MITIAKGDDWIAIYDSDGDCIYQDHRIDSDRLLELIGIECKSVWAQAQLDRDRGFPPKLEDLEPDA